MSYTINKTDTLNNGSVVVEDGTVNNETSLKFVGKNSPNYAVPIAENFLHLLENFASDGVEPTNPIIGQVWYDTSITLGSPQLKVYDGTKWVASGNITKKTVQPTTATIGDLWVDTANQQLYLWSGSSWILVGPEFSEGVQSGPKVESIFDTLNISHTIISFIVAGETIIIISKDSFIPKLTIDGFVEIKQGINISSKDFDLDGTLNNRLWGTADRATKLVVSGYPEGLDANNFLRSDVTSTTNYPLIIRNNGGITLGADLNSSITNNSSGNTIIYNRNEGSTVYVRINNAGTDNDVLTIKPQALGVNNTNPLAALDVSGTVKVSGNTTITSTSDSSALGTGSLVTAGGASVAKTLRVGTGANVTGTITSNNILPSTNNAFDIGSESFRYKTIFANTVGNLDGSTIFRGEFTGAFNGSVTGTATRLTSPTLFSLTGDVTSNTISFNGQQVGGVAVFNTSISPDLIDSKDETLETSGPDLFLIHRPGVGLKKVTKTTLLSNVATIPAGTILPFAGANPPNGYLLCDGAEVLISSYPELYAVIGTTYNGAYSLIGLATFRIPDLRGRFPLGADNMNNGIAVPLAPTGATAGTTTIDVDGNPSSTANRVTAITADEVGLGSGLEEQQILIKNLPQHTHNLEGESGTQFFVVHDDINGSTSVTDADAIAKTAQLAPGFSKVLSTVGNVESVEIDVPLNVMNPHLTLNYIIFTGRFA